MQNQIIIVANSTTDEVVTERTITDKAGVSRTVGVVMVQSKALTSLSSLGRVATRTAFITLEQDALAFLGSSLRDGATFPVQGKIVIQETTVPYISSTGKTQEAKINPTTKQVVTYKGQPVYRNSFFTEDVNMPDTLLIDAKSHLSLQMASLDADAVE